MTAGEMLNIAAAQIAATDTRARGLQGLFVTDKQLHVQPMKERKPNDLEIWCFYPFQAHRGLSSKEWNALEETLRKLQKEGLL